MPRWTIVPLLRSQSVAEHSWAVAIIAMELAKKMGVGTEEIAHRAVLHDIAEVLTGDVPSPLKKAMVEAGVGHIVHHDPIEADDLIGAIVKIADTMEAIIYINKWGNTNQTALIFDEMYHRLEDELEEYDTIRGHVFKIIEEALDD